jgi:hypothetical protein
MDLKAFGNLTHKEQRAYFMGQASVSTNVSDEWKTNPYPPGREHDLYDLGQADATVGDQIKFVWPEAK